MIRLTVSLATDIFPRVRMYEEISGQGKRKKSTSGHSCQVFWSPTLKTGVDQSDVSSHAIMSTFYVAI